MALVADTSSKGLWIAPGTVAGTHALIVGVSSYPFLSGGSAPVRAPNSGGLPQLRNSALTAARIFDWLKGAESVAGATVASCRLLLSPVEAEKAEIDRLTGGNYGVPDFEIFRAAIEAWRNAIFAARNEHGTNTAFFFFSGHGVEHLASPALLAADILDPNAAGSETRAVAIEAVGRAIKTSGIDRALLFVDACRNAPAVAMTLHIVGQEIINPVPYPARSPDAVMSLQSTRSGLQSFQAPDDPATIFGRAVIEALDGPPPSYAPYDVASAPWALRFASFESYVKKRVPELLAAYTASKTQPVEASGMPYDREMVVASRSPLAPPPVSTLTPPDIATVIAQRSDDLLQHFKTFSTGLGGDRPTAPGIGDISDYSTMHEVFGHESVTVPFLDALSVLDARTGQPFPTSDLHLMLGRSSERADTLTTWLDVE
ncbi:MAG TPA: hypothetical protein VFQ87_04990, partial [Bradyrhizobium sp.]|nr:hypothetical protein [Bradyrhizobium sp.]